MLALHAHLATDIHHEVVNRQMASSSSSTEVFTIFGIVSSTFDLRILATALNDENVALATQASTVQVVAAT